ncbi:MAG: branched-chain amino acid ABC transporter permease [Acidimicrobiales bacterium]
MPDPGPAPAREDQDGAGAEVRAGAPLAAGVTREGGAPPEGAAPEGAAPEGAAPGGVVVPAARGSYRALPSGARGWRRWGRRVLPVVVTVGVLAVAPQVYDNIAFLTTLAVYMVLAEGINVIYGYTGYLPFGYVGFFGAGAYGASLSVVDWHFPGLVALVFGGLVAGIFGLVLAPLLRLSGAYFALASLAASQVMYYVVSNEPWTYGESGMSLPAVLSSDQTYVVAVALAGLAALVVVFVRDSHFGLSLRAVRADPVSAAMAGIDVVRARTSAWLISAVLAGLAGGIWAVMTAAFYAQTPFDLTLSVYAIVFALFGGVRTVLGPVLGALALYSLYQYIGVSNPQYFELVYGLLIFALILFLPGGFFSLVGGPGDRPPWWERFIERVLHRSSSSRARRLGGA